MIQTYYLCRVVKQTIVYETEYRHRNHCRKSALSAACRLFHVPSGSGCGRYLIIFYDSAIGKEKLLEAVKKYGSEVLYEYKNFNSIAVTVPPKYTVSKTIRFYKKVRGVLSVSEDRKMELH